MYLYYFSFHVFFHCLHYILFIICLRMFYFLIFTLLSHWLLFVLFPEGNILAFLLSRFKLLETVPRELSWFFETQARMLSFFGLFSSVCPAHLNTCFFKMPSSIHVRGFCPVLWVKNDLVKQFKNSSIIVHVWFDDKCYYDCFSMTASMQLRFLYNTCTAILSISFSNRL